MTRNTTGNGTFIVPQSANLSQEKVREGIYILRTLRAGCRFAATDAGRPDRETVYL